MIASKVKDLINQTNVTQKDVAEGIGFSENGFSKALKSDDPKVSLLQKLSAYFKIPMTYWFQDQEGNFFLNNEGNLVNGSSFKGNLTVNKGAQEETARIQAENEQLRKELEMMKQLLAAKDETIAALKSK